MSNTIVGHTVATLVGMHVGKGKSYFGDYDVVYQWPIWSYKTAYKPYGREK